MSLEDASLDIVPGELLAVVGENGAGKSSLMNVLYGLYHPDAGTFLMDGKPVRFKSPRDAIAKGIGMVHQHFMLVPTLTVAENVVLGREPTKRGLLDLDRACDEVAATAKRFGFQLDPRARVDTLTVGSQQKVEIVKALHRGAQVLILDEPTAVLTPQESDELSQVMRGLVAQGRTVVLISHKLKEVLGVADRVAVMRRGRTVAEVRASETTVSALAALMVGEGSRGAAMTGVPATAVATTGLSGTGTTGATEARPLAPVEPDAPATPTGPVVLEAKDLRATGDNGRPALQGVSLTVRAGEIVGIAGVDGNGQRELAEVLTGLRKLDGGEGTLLGGPLAGLTPAMAKARGVGHVPEDRLARAVVKAMTVEENVALGRHRQPPFARGPWVDFKGRRERTNQLLTGYDVRPNDPTVALQALSGGNQQKVVVARELDADPKLLVVVQPTRGLDIGAVAQVHERLRDAKARGAGVVMVSLDLEEVLALSDRVYVLYEGRVTGHFPRKDLDERELGRRMLGAEGSHG
ncbi:ABC transporter ATP-binding protein [Corallococcus coralloides DSM 2259]|uniref:ABC transporter ATP-binding protein n=1 Tax=Corallococcus coralloides (strain ATCC 25202 / DSM 2259 / NBRC 100086 / M2) TaxID=1144275 RepID=H8MNQ8_CORCM|nr:ABC transporter ATP-binding protein [Corallococcus coralloides]AFE11150.1 ABC transporter ATP-binding protein [Corallococcus coralloides DSM 2259]